MTASRPYGIVQSVLVEADALVVEAVSTAQL